jgi:hypothetical protein
MKSSETCKKLLKIPFLISTLPCLDTNTKESSPIRMGGPMHYFKYKRTYSVAAMSCDAP